MTSRFSSFRALTYRGLKCRGLTLVEVLLATSIMALALIPIIGVFAEHGKRSITQIQNRMIGLNFARQKIELYRSTPYDEVTVPASGSDSITSSGITYLRTWMVTEIDWDTVPSTFEAKKVRVEVAWKEQKKMQRVYLVNALTDEHRGILF